MIKVLGGLKDILRQAQEDVTIDGALFRFHNVVTAVLLFACSLIITGSQYVGAPIQCMVDGIPVHPVNTYCWITSTFTMPEAFSKQIGREVPHPGVANEMGAGEDAKKYYSYYQWVCFILFFQGLACYTPKWIWDNWEGGLMSTLVMGMNHHVMLPEERKRKKEVLLMYLIDHIKRHRLYAVRYWLCEGMCLLNLVIQMYLMNRFFDGEFYNYGLRVVNLMEENQENRVDPMVYVFPRVTKCTFHKYGPSGSIQKHDALCVLPLNIVNEKTYVLIWFWFVFLSMAFVGLFLYRLGLFLCPAVRPKLLQIKRRKASAKDAEVVARNLDIGDWWVLYMLGKNIDPIVYNEILIDLARKFDDSMGDTDVSTMKIR